LDKKYEQWQDQLEKLRPNQVLEDNSPRQKELSNGLARASNQRVSNENYKSLLI
jgi:hypothetical protein